MSEALVLAPHGDWPAAVADLVADRWAPNTRRAYAAAWRSWTTWCQAHDLAAYPAAPLTLAAYLADVAGHYRLETLRLHVSCLRTVHRMGGAPSPVVEPVPSVLAGLARRRSESPRQKRALRLAELRAAVIALREDPSLRAVRDVSILVVGWASALRRSELAALRLADVEDLPEGIALRIARGKTDPSGQGRRVGLPWGRTELCPVRALGAWRELRGDAPPDAPLWVGIAGHGTLRSTPLDPRTICRVVQRAVRRIGRAPAGYGAHSLRAGFATEAAAAGIAEHRIARQTGHRSVAVLRSYVREGELLDAQHPLRSLL